MRLVAGFDEVVSAWVAERIGIDPNWGPHTAIGVADAGDNLVGGVVYNNYQPQNRNIEVSFAASRADWLTPTLIHGLLSYPFDQLKVARITSTTPKRNRRARQFLIKFGFKHEGTIRFGHGDDHTIISGLLASEWAQSRFNRGPVGGQQEATYCA